MVPSKPLVAFLILPLLFNITVGGRYSMLEDSNLKITHLHFYFHDLVTGSNSTVARVARAPGSRSSAPMFGDVAAFDDWLTSGPELNSTHVGNAQGIYVTASQEESALLIAMTFMFTSGKHSGSSLSLMGRNNVASNVREIPVIGGTGRFRLARGYAVARTRMFELETGNAVVEYDVYVMH